MPKVTLQVNGRVGMCFQVCVIDTNPSQRFLLLQLKPSSPNPFIFMFEHWQWSLGTVKQLFRGGKASCVELDLRQPVLSQLPTTYSLVRLLISNWPPHHWRGTGWQDSHNTLPWR